jgi:universal stress protein A
VGLDRLKQILVPTDFSDSSGTPLRAAIEVARAFGASIEIFHVDVDLSDDSLLAESIIPVQTVFESQRAETAEHLRRVTDQVRQAGVLCTASAEVGRSAEAIIQHAGRGGVGLVVLGKHVGRSRRPALFGHVVEKVIQRAPCPVLVVPLPSE